MVHSSISEKERPQLQFGIKLSLEENHTGEFIDTFFKKLYNMIHICWFVPLTDAALSVGCRLVAGVAGALVGSRHVDTLPVLAQVVTQLALVHI